MNTLAPSCADWPRRRTVLKRGLFDLQADIVALQEVEKSRHYDQARDLLGSGWYIKWNQCRTDKGIGGALASRWPISLVREIDERPSPRVVALSGGYTSLVVKIEAPAPFARLIVVNHKPVWPYNYEYERESQAIAVASVLEEVVAEHTANIILLGDLDAGPESASVRFLTGYQSLHGTSVCYRDAWAAVWGDRSGHTFSPFNPLVRAGDMPGELGRRIDYILVRCGRHGPTLDVARCDRVFVDAIDGVQASDHYGLLADLVLPAHPPGSCDFL